MSHEVSVFFVRFLCAGALSYNDTITLYPHPLPEFTHTRTHPHTHTHTHTHSCTHTHTHMHSHTYTYPLHTHTHTDTHTHADPYTNTHAHTHIYQLCILLLELVTCLCCHYCAVAIQSVWVTNGIMVMQWEREYMCLFKCVWKGFRWSMLCIILVLNFRK